MLIYRHLTIMVYSEKLLTIIALMKCEDHHKKKLIQGFNWTEIYFGHFVQAAPILFGHLEIFYDIFSKLIFYTINGIAICPSQIKTRGSFATISDGKCGLIDCLAFYFMRRVELVGRCRWKWVGYCFLLFFAAAA